MTSTAMSEPRPGVSPGEVDLRQSLAAALRDHWWSATDDETCSCGWVAPMWAEAGTGSDDEAERNAADIAHTAFLEHQAAALASLLGSLRDDGRLREAVLAERDAEKARADAAVEALARLRAQVAAVERLIGKYHAEPLAGLIRAALAAQPTKGDGE